MDIKDFIGFYPSITDKNFYQKIYNKKEFHELELDRKINKDEYILNHQNLLQDFYHHILLIIGCYYIMKWDLVKLVLLFMPLN